jgi:hypothetical protein
LTRGVKMMMPRKHTDPRPLPLAAKIKPLGESEVVIELEALFVDEWAEQSGRWSHAGTVSSESRAATQLAVIPGGKGNSSAPPLLPEPTVILDRLYPLSPENAALAMEEATDLEELLVALALGAHHYLDHVQVYLHVPSRSVLLGRVAVDEGRLDVTQVQQRRIPLDVPSLFTLTVARKTSYVGDTPDVGTTASILSSIGVDGVNLAVVPVILDGETYGLIIGHSGASPLSDKVSSGLCVLAVGAQAAMSRQSTALTLYAPEVKPVPRLSPPEPRALAPVPTGGLGEPALRALVRQLSDWDSSVRANARRELRKCHDTEPLLTILDEIRAVLTEPDPRPRREAIEILGQLADREAVPRLIALLRDPERTVADAARSALVSITRQDFGLKQPHWTRWWGANRHRSRQEWLIDGLVHRDLQLRAAAVAELEEIYGEPLDYDPTAPKRQRENVRQRCLERLSFQRWWADNAV